MDDVLLVVMEDGLTVAEKTMVDEFGEEDLVRNVRQVFQNRMTERLVGIVERLIELRVVTYQTQVMFNPDRLVWIFFFDTPAPGSAVYAMAEERLRQHEVGEASDQSVLGSEEPGSPDL